MSKRPILITVISLIFVSAAISACHVEVANDFSGDLKVLHEKTFKIEPGKGLKLDASFGDVMITSWDKAEVYVKILGNEKTEKKVDFDFDQSDDLVTIIADYDRPMFNFFNSNMRMRFEIKVPKSFNTYTKTSGGDVKLAEIIGDNIVKTSGGDVNAKYTAGKLKVSTSGGDIILDNTEGENEVSTSGGDIRARYFTGSLYASTSGGDIDLDGSDAKVTAKTSGGDIKLDYKGENLGIELSTSGGDITLSLPEDFDASARLSTSGGDIKCNLNTSDIIKITSSKFEADLNEGGRALVAKTSGGDIRVYKK